MRKVTIVVAGAALIALALHPPAVGETPPPESLFSPRVVEIPVLVEDVALQDSLGGGIPLTGKGVETLETSTLVYPPRLPPGVYTLVWEGGQQPLVVDGAGFRIEETLAGISSRRSDGPTMPGPAGSIAAASGLAAGMLLIRSGRRGAGALVVAAAAAAAGALIVSPSDQANVDPCIALSDSIEHQQCSFSHLYLQVEENGVADAVEELLRLAGPGGDTRWRLQCHETAHMIGEVGWKLEQEVEAMVAAGDPDCQFGYFHGMLEAMGAYLNDTEFPPAVLRACALIGERFGQDFSITGGCSHGVGHASMWRYGADYMQAREVCERFTDTMEREECVSGAVMEWVASRDRANSMGSDRDLPLPRVENAFDLCAEPYGELTSGCVSGAALGVAPDQLEEAAETCSSAESEVHLPCLNFLIRTILDVTPFDMAARAERVAELCENHPWDIGEGRCYAYLGYDRFLNTASRESAEELCVQFNEEKAVRGCREGIEEGERYQQNLVGR